MTCSRRTMDHSFFPDARLTSKGFALLGKVPDGVNEQMAGRSFAQQLKSAVEDGAKGLVSDLIKSLFTRAVALGISAVDNA